MADKTAISVASTETLVAGLASLNVPRNIRRYVDVSAVRATASDWTADSKLYDQAREDDDVATRCVDLPLARASQATTLGRLASFDPPSVHGMFYLLPVLAAWGALAFIEHEYSAAYDASEPRPAFFAWWSDQTFAPWVFSLGLAAVILVVMGLEVRARLRTRDVRAFRIEVDSSCQRLANRVSRVLAESRRPELSPEQGLTVASTRLASASASLTRITEMLGEGGTAEGRAVTSAAELSKTLTGLNRTIDRLATATNGLVISAEALPLKITSWEDDLESLTALRELVASQGKLGSEASARFTDGVGKLVAALPQVDTTIGATLALGEKLTAGQADVRELLEAVQAEGASASERNDAQGDALRARVDELRSVVKAMEEAAAEMTRAGETLYAGISIVDGLQQLRITS